MATQKIETGLIADSAVTTAKLADNSVTAAKIAAGSLDDQVKGISSSADAVAITIDSSENVGIGTSSPHANSKVTIERSSDQLRLTDGSLGYDIGYDNSYLRFKNSAGDTHAVINWSTGNVGIGTDSPVTALEISTDGTDQLTLNRADASINTNNTLAGIVVSADDPTANRSGAKIGFTAGDNWTTNYFPTNIIFSNDDAGSMTERMRIDSSGNVGIGTDSPSQALHVAGSGSMILNDSTNWSYLRLKSPNTNGGYIQFADADDDDVGQIFYYHGSGGDYMSFTTNASEAMRINSSGTLLVGTTDDSHFGGSTNSGLAVYNSGITGISRSAGTVLYVNRQTSDGDIITFRKDGSIVGTISTISSDLNIGTSNCRLRFISSAADIRPVYSTGLNYDAAIDLGDSNARFKDLYLSGNVRVDAGQGIFFSGAAGASGMTSQVLDDYEEGTFDPTFTPASGSITPYTSYDTFAYTKVGRVVTITGTMATSSVSSPSGALTFGNLPFAMASDTPNRASLTRPSIHIYATGSGAPTQNKYYSAFIAFAHQGTSGDVFATYNATHDDSIADWFAAGSDMFVNFSYITNS